MITAQTKLCMVIGDPVEHSLSPLLHNTGYQALGIDNDFAYVACRVDPDTIEDFVRGVRAMGVRGISCTMPHKEIIMPYLDKIDETAEVIGAVNTVVQEGGQLIGYNTDWIGTVAPLAAMGELVNKRAAIIGAGGAAKAMAYGLLRSGAQVTILGRTVAKAKLVAERLGCTAQSLDELAGLEDFDIICNATPVGMGETAGESPIDCSLIGSQHVVLDAIYNPHTTTLLGNAAARGARIVHGSEMLLHQAMAQFELYTGQAAPEAAMRDALDLVTSVGAKQ